MKVAVVGATGAVGRVLLEVLAERRFPVTELIPFASARSQGKPLDFMGRSYACRLLTAGCFQGVDIAFFDASDEVSRQWAPHAAENGAFVVDNSGAFRMDPQVPLVVPEINGHLVAKSGARLIAGPNCSTVQLALALEPLRRKWGLKRVVVSTYQSVSGAGSAAVDRLREQRHDQLTCIPQIGGFQADGYTSEERKIIEESRKILDLPDLRIDATAVRVPVVSCHGESVNVELDRACTAEEARQELRAMPGLEVLDEPLRAVYPTGLTGAGRDPVYVGRLRVDRSVPHGLTFWVLSDNLRKGAALNAVQIGERWRKDAS